MTSPLSWERYRTLLAVLEQGSLSGAARQLGIAQPTVGRHIGELEASFARPLFTRSQKGLLATELALALRGHCEAMQRTARALERAAVGEAPGVGGTVRVSASEVIAVEVLPTTLARLQREHPRLRIELVASNRLADLLQREADIAVRMAEPRQDALIARRVGEVELGLHAREDYLTRCGTPSAPAELERHALIGFDEETPFLRLASRSLPGVSREDFRLRSDSDLAQLALIRAGAGIGVCQVPLARRDPRLVRVLADDFALRLRTWVAMHEDLRGNPACKVVFDALVACMLEHAAPGRA